MRKALTLVEMLLVFSLVAILATTSFMSFWGTRMNQALSSSAASLQIVLSRAKNYARDGRDEKAWGVIKSGATSYELLSGGPKNFSVVQTFYLDSPTRFTSDDWGVWFKPGDGTTKEAAEIKLISPRGAVAVVHVSSTGLVEISK